MGIPRATIAEGDNRNCDDSKDEDACASTVTTSAHRQRATTQPVAVMRPEDERRRRCDKWGVASCDNQLAKKRLRQSCKAESATEQQQGQHDNQLANKRQTGGEAFKRQTGNGR